MNQVITDELLEDFSRLQATISDIKQKLHAEEDVEMDYLKGYREGFKDGFLESRQDLYILKHALEEIHKLRFALVTDESETLKYVLNITAEVLAEFKEGERNI